VIINALPEGELKISLLARINAVQIKINIALVNLKVEILEDMANILSTQEAIYKAQAYLDDLVIIINNLPDGENKTVLLARINAVQVKINIALVNLKIVILEGMTVDLSTEVLIHNTQIYLNELLVLINALPEGEHKTVLLARINAVQVKINIALVNLKVVILEGMTVDLSTEVLINNTQIYLNELLVLINALPEGEHKTVLLARINAVQVKISIALENLKIVILEGMTVDLSTEVFIHNTQIYLNDVLVLINALPEGEHKTVLLARINAVQVKINIALATLKVVILEGMTDNLSTLDLIDKAQLYLNQVLVEVSVLEDEDAKNNLIIRIDIVQKKIDAARESLMIKPTITVIANNRVLVSNEFTAAIASKEVKDVFAGDITVSYDTDLFEFIEAEALQSVVYIVYKNESTSGKINFIIACNGEPNVINGNTNLFTMKFRSRGKVGTGDIVVLNGLVADRAGNEIATQCEKATITVGYNCDINGDGKISLGDLAIVASDIGQDKSLWYNNKVDINMDGKVDKTDLGIITEEVTKY
jgi:hypothetical protein